MNYGDQDSVDLLIEILDVIVKGVEAERTESYLDCIDWKVPRLAVRGRSR